MSKKIDREEEFFKDNFTHHDVYLGDLERLVGGERIQVFNIFNEYGPWSIVKKSMIIFDGDQAVLAVEVENRFDSLDLYSEHC